MNKKALKTLGTLLAVVAIICEWENEISYPGK